MLRPDDDPTSLFVLGEYLPRGFISIFVCCAMQIGKHLRYYNTPALIYSNLLGTAVPQMFRYRWTYDLCTSLMFGINYDLFCPNNVYLPF